MQMHFDIAQKDTIIWENESDIPLRLCNKNQGNNRLSVNCRKRGEKQRPEELKCRTIRTERYLRAL